jgi:uncharacterized protein (DUF1810 family)
MPQPPHDEFDLQRFVDAQARVYDDVLDELRHGQKRSHWMWFIFPQIAGLGSSPMARAYALRSIEEARAYLGHPLLGERLRNCTRLVNAISGKSAHDIFGSPDDLKFCSSMTLFAEAAGDEEEPFDDALRRFHAGRRDGNTLRILGL